MATVKRNEEIPVFDIVCKVIRYYEKGVDKHYIGMLIDAFYFGNRNEKVRQFLKEYCKENNIVAYSFLNAEQLTALAWAYEYFKFKNGLEETFPNSFEEFEGID